MALARIPVLALFALLAPFAACATGDNSFGLGDAPPVGTQSTGSDGGTTVLEAAASSDDANGLPVSTDDSAAPSTSDAQTSDDAGSTVDSASPPPPPVDAAPPPVDSGSTSSCPGYAPPSTSAGCTCDPSLHTCAANGCYGGYYCKLSTTSCVKKPSTC